MKRILIIIAALFATAQAQTIQTIGAPTTTVVSRGNFRTDSIFYLPKRQKLPTDSGAVRYQISDSSVYYWTGSQWRRLGVHIDTASMLNPYLRGSGTANYLPKFNASRSIVDSKVYESATNLMFNTTTPYFTTSGIGSFDINGSTASVLVLRKADTARGYWSHNGSTMDINNIAAGDIRFYTNAQLRGRFQTDGTFRLNSLTGTGSRIVTADADGVLSATSSATGLVDTTVLSTRAWRQKGDDSLGAIIATKGSGTVTSVATGYGLSGGTITTTGTIIVDSAIVASRLRVGKVVDSLGLVKQNVLTNPVTGTGTTNYVPKFTGTSTIGNSQIFDNGTNVGIGTTSMAAKFHVIGGGIFESANTGGVITQFRNSTIESLGYIGVEGNTGGIQLTGTTANATFVASGATGRNLQFGTAGVIRMTLNPNGELLLNTTTDVGAYVLQANGAIYNTTGAVFAATSGNVGVGTASPSEKLEVFRSGSGDVAALIANSVSNNYFMTRGTGKLELLTTSGEISFSPNLTQRATFTTAGEFLISTTLDAGDYKLQVSGNAYVTGTTVLAATSGNVGIGSTTANAKLHVTNGSAYVTAATSQSVFLRLYANAQTSNQLEIGQGFASTTDNIGYIFNTANAALIFGTNYIDRGRFEADGDLVIGGTSASASAIVDITSTTKGFLPPRMTTTQRDLISSPAAGLVIYNTTTSKLQVYTTAWTDLH